MGSKYAFTPKTRSYANRAVLNPPRQDPFAAALARSTTNTLPSSLSFAYPTPESSPSSDNRTPLPQTTPATPTRGVDSIDRLASMDKAFGKKRSKGIQPPWKCQVIVCVPTPVDPTPSGKGGKPEKNKSTLEPEHLIRANSLAGYWELNRRFLRTLPPTPRMPDTANGTDEHPPISSSAQISPDSLIGEGTRVGDRASIKKCVVGRHCHIGRGAKLTGCVLWDFVTVEEK